LLKKLLANLVEGICLFLMVVLCVDVFLGVFSRYVLASTFTWYDEVARACFVWMVFLGTALGVKHRQHFGLHFLVDKLLPRARQAAELLGALVVMAFAAVLIQQGWALVAIGRAQRTPVMEVSKAWIYLAIPVGGALIICYSLAPAWRAVRGFFGGDLGVEPPTTLRPEEQA
jgi:TRAP-type C4-dicarboxylate transport system permease small subunit